jgi:hypothetical protein
MRWTEKGMKRKIRQWSSQFVLLILIINQIMKAETRKIYKILITKPPWGDYYRYLEQMG